jgi:hypothetical protein
MAAGPSPYHCYLSPDHSTATSSGVCGVSTALPPASATR